MNGHLFKPGAGIIHDVGTDDTDFKLAVITNIFYVVNGTIAIFKVDMLEFYI